MRFNRKSVIGAAVAMALSSSAMATDTIIFDPTGTAGPGGDLANIATFDWNVGNAVSLGGNPAGGLQAGDTSNVVYQANLSVINNNLGNPVYTNGSPNYFTVVSRFGEIATNVIGTSATFGFNPADPNNFFTIYRTPTFGDNLTGEGFIGTSILTGAITSVQSSNFAFSSTTPVLLDQFNGDQLGGQLTATGGGQSAITITINVAGVDANYFPDLFTGNTISLVFFTSEQKTPYQQGQPSNCFLDPDAVGTNDGCDGITRNLGSVNGLPLDDADRDFQFQVDGSNSFQRVQAPEPGSVALLGIGIGALGFAARRRSKKS